MLLRQVTLAAFLVCCTCARTRTLALNRRSSGADGSGPVCRGTKLRLEATLGLGGQGLFNQHLSLLSFLTIGITAGADELLISGSRRRDKWDKDATWLESKFTDIWNATALKAYLADRGVTLLTEEQPADDNVWVLDDADLQPHRDPADGADFIRKHIADQLRRREASAKQQKGADAKTLLVPVRGLLLSTLSQHSHLHADVARNVHFSGHLQALADKAVARLLELTGAKDFNGVHLRIEGDSPQQDFMNGREAMLQAYVQAFQEVEFDESLPLYVSSGVFDQEPEFAATWRHNKSSVNSHKEVLLPKADLDSLHSEQRAALDFLVLVRASRFVGWAGSSFSFWASEHRRMAGFPPNATLLVRREEAGAGTHELFVLSNTVYG